MSWMNTDGLYVKFGNEEAAPAHGGFLNNIDGAHEISFYVDYTDVLSATYTVLGAASGTTTGEFGVIVPKNFYIEYVQVFTQTAFTSSGTIGTSTFSLGTKRATDRSTEIDHDGLLTTSFTGGSIDAAGERNTVAVGSTGAGALIGINASSLYDGVIVVANTQHASHPFTAGKAIVRIRGHWGTTQ